MRLMRLFFPYQSQPAGDIWDEVFWFLPMLFFAGVSAVPYFSSSGVLLGLVALAVCFLALCYARMRLLDSSAIEVNGRLYIPPSTAGINQLLSVFVPGMVICLLAWAIAGRLLGFEPFPVSG